jgi:hypothetical protein
VSRAITDTAILVGFSPKGKCVYSDSIPLGEYWDGNHVWDSAKSVKKLKLQKLRGYLFDSDGELIQEFESTFDIRRGIFANGWTRHGDGTFQEIK